MDPSRYYKNTEGHFDRNLYVLSEYEKRKHARAHFVAARTITDAYSFLTKKDECEESIRIGKRVAEFYDSRPILFNKITDDIWAKALEASDKESTVSNEVKAKRPTVKEWLERCRNS